MKLKGIILKIKKLLDDIYSGQQTYNKKITKWIINIYKIFVVSTKKFLEDDCLTKASSISYTAIVSLIPTLTVVLTFYSIYSGVGNKKEELFARLTTFLVEHNIKLNIDPVIEAISSLIDNAGKVGGIGVVILIFSAISLLRTLDKSLNYIWNIKKRRAIFLQIIYFWTALSLCPIIIISGSALANQITSMLSYPNYYSSGISNDGKIWAVGNKADIIYSENNINFNNLPAGSIDFENQQVFNFDGVSKIFTAQDFRIEQMEFEKSEFRDVQFINDSGWIVGKNGMLLHTNDGGKLWKLKKLGSLGFNDICMINEEKGFIAADNGYLLITDNGWQQIQVKEWNDITSNLKSVTFSNDHGIITGERGLIIFTKDGGESWDYAIIPESKINKQYVDINKAYFLNKNKILLACNEGIILASSDSGRTWIKEKIYNKNFYTGFFYNDNTGFFAGVKGVFISTNNGGKTWSRQSLSAANINALQIKNNTFWAFGDNGMMLKSVDNARTWDGKRGKSIIVYLIDFLAPFVYIWILFLLVYMFFPNTKIPFKPAAIGAAFTGTVLVIFLLLFEVYVRLFSKGKMAIYGALAAIPIFLSLIYILVLFVLYGAEVSYTLMHPHTYIKLKKDTKYKKDFYIYNGISLLYIIYKQFESGKGSASYTELIKSIFNNKEELDYFIELFKQENLIMDTLDGNLSPANSSKNIYLRDMISLIHDVSFIIPGAVSRKDKLSEFMDDLFNKITKSKDDIVKDITLADVIEKTA